MVQKQVKGCFILSVINRRPQGRVEFPTWKEKCVRSAEVPQNKTSENKRDNKERKFVLAIFVAGVGCFTKEQGNTNCLGNSIHMSLNVSLSDEHEEGLQTGPRLLAAG